MIYQYQGSQQSYWNIGVNLAIPVEDILDLTAAVKRKRIEAEKANIEKDIAYDQLKLQITTLYIRIRLNEIPYRYNHFKGVFPIDFPSEELISHIINQNNIYFS